MNFKEDLKQMVHTHQALFFVDQFFVDHPQAELYLVGGMVRDLIMKRRVLDVDFDFVIRRLPRLEIEKWFSARGTIDFVGHTFGVYKFLPENLESTNIQFIDIALPRTEQAHATNQGGYKEFDVQSDESLSIEDDLSRRDFTMNAMAINMKTGELIDPFFGVADIKKKLIQSVGNPRERFAEDLSRVLRAIRFAAELSFEIEERTLGALREQKDAVLTVVPRETIGMEIAKALSRNPFGAVDWMNKSGMMEILFRSDLHMEPFKRVQPGQLTVACALLFQGLTKDQIYEQLSKTGLDSLPRGTSLRIEPSDVVWLVEKLEQNLTEHSVESMRASLFEKQFMNGRATLLFELLRVTQNDPAIKSAKQRATEIRERWSADEHDSIPSLLSGNDFIDAGIPAGPRVRELLEDLRDEQLEGRILTREQAKKWIQTKTP